MVCVVLMSGLRLGLGSGIALCQLHVLAKTTKRECVCVGRFGGRIPEIPEGAGSFINLSQRPEGRTHGHTDTHTPPCYNMDWEQHQTKFFGGIFL